MIWKCPYEITLCDNDMKSCLEFAKKSAPTQQAIEYGQHTTAPRDVTEIERDNQIGKIAEVAFKRIIEKEYPKTGKIALDFDIYKRGEYDDHDAVIHGHTIDIKATREGGEWFLIEWNKLRFRAKEGKLPHYFTFFTVGWNRKTDKPTGTACLEGFIPTEWLNREHAAKDDRILILHQGDKIPGKGSILQADNYAIHKSHIGKAADYYIQQILRTEADNNLSASFQLP